MVVKVTDQLTTLHACVFGWCFRNAELSVKEFRMKPKISFLIGSGFSIPEGIPGVREVNEKLANLKAKNLNVHTDLRAFLVEDSDVSQDYFHGVDRVFYQDFTEFYVTKLQGEGRPFHYEDFYDYFIRYLYFGENKAEIESFYAGFVSKNFADPDKAQDCHQMLHSFETTFAQILAEMLSRAKYYEAISYSGYPPYHVFTNLLWCLSEKSDVKVHSLNHDVFFEFLFGQGANVFTRFTDGFELAGSPYYGKLNRDLEHSDGRRLTMSYWVKLAHFTNNFDKPISLFKLHGSVGTKLVYHNAQNPDTNELNPYTDSVFIKTQYAVSDCFVEHKDPATGKMRFAGLHDQVAPLYLSGTTMKENYYGEPYYAPMFEHFKNNLADSELLIVTGYGFGDRGINKYLEENYLSLGKKWIIIDPFKPKSDLLTKYNAVIVEKGITDVTLNEFKQLIPDNLVTWPSVKSPYDMTF